MKKGEKLRELREKKGLTQAKLGDVIGVSRQVIFDWEKGVAPVPEKRLAQIAEFFSKPIAYFEDDATVGEKSPLQEVILAARDKYPAIADLADVVRDVASDHVSSTDEAALWLMKEGAKVWGEQQKAKQAPEGRHLSGRFEGASVLPEQPVEEHQDQKSRKKIR